MKPRLHTFIRLSRFGNALRRPGAFDPVDCVKGSALLFGRSPYKVTVVVDDVSLREPLTQGDNAVDPMDIFLADVSGNSESTSALLDRVLSGDPHVPLYILEDDYFHAKQAPQLILEGLRLNPTGYVTLFDDPLYYFPSSDVESVDTTTTLVVGQSRHWATTPSTTMTFAAMPWVLRRDLDQIRRFLPLEGKPGDRELWAALRARCTLLRCIPGAASHLETTAASPFLFRGLSAASVPPTSTPWWWSWVKQGPTAISGSVSQRTIDEILAHSRTGRVVDVEAVEIATLLQYPVVVVSDVAKSALDRRLRARGTRNQVVVVDGVPSRCERWFSGRDVSADEVLNALKAHL